MPHIGIGAVELHVVGVVLDAFEDAIAVGIPAAGNPGEFEGFFDARPDAAQPVDIAGERPIEVGVHDLAHGAIGGGEAPERLFVRQVLAEMQGARVVHVVAETGGAQGAGEGGEEMGGDGLVVPDVGATAVAAAGVIVGAFEAVELAIGGAEADGGDQRGEIGAGGVFDGGGDGGFAQGGGELARLLFQRVEVARRRIRRRPRHRGSAWCSDCRGACLRRPWARSSRSGAACGWENARRAGT